MSVAKSIDEALDLLKGTESEPIEETQEALEEVETDIEKAYDFNMVKAENDAEIQQLIQADGFMTALSQNQDYNTEKLVKGLSNNYRATEAVLTFMKSFAEKLDNLETVVSSIAGTPQPTKGALTKEEAKHLAKGEVVGDKGQKDTVTLTKALVLDTLEKGMAAGSVQDSDVLRADSSLSAYEEVSAEMLSGLSHSAQKFLKESLDL